MAGTTDSNLKISFALDTVDINNKGGLLDNSKNDVGTYLVSSDIMLITIDERNSNGPKTGILKLWFRDRNFCKTPFAKRKVFRG